MILAKLLAADFQSQGDQQLEVFTGGSPYVIRYIVVTGSSGPIETAQGGIYSEPDQGGEAIMGGENSFAGNGLGDTPRAWASLGAYTNLTYPYSTMFFHVTVPNDAPATANIFVIGEILA